jgi:iron complex transport system substrate-binding protein
LRELLLTCLTAILRLGIRAVVGLLACVNVAAAEGPAPKPARIVSLNMCADDLVLRIAKPANIASVTWLSRDPQNSNLYDRAPQVPVNHGLAEEIVPLEPDLVIAGTFTARTAVALIKRTPVRLVELGIPKSFAEVRSQIAHVAELVGEPAEGARLIKAMEARLAAVGPPSGSRPRAIVLNPNGATVGRGTLVAEIMELAGLDNVAAELKMENYGLVPLENVVLNSVDMLIVSASRDGPPSLATDILRHPVLAKLADRVKVVSIPTRLWNCGGPAAAEAVTYLRDIVTAYKRERAIR